VIVRAVLAAVLLAMPALAATEIPFRWTPGQIEVQVAVNGRPPIWFIVDTGAEYSILDREVAKSYGITGDRFAGGVTLAIGPVTMRDQTIMLMALDNFRRQKREIRGLVGYDFFARHVVTIDFQRRELLLSQPPAPNATRFPLRFAGRLPVTDGILTIGQKRLKAALMIDTGASQAVILRHPFAERHGLLAPDARTTTSETVAAGPTTWIKIPVQQLELGRWKFPSPNVSAYSTTRGAGGYTETDGVLGNEVLKRFRVTFDYGRKAMWLEDGPQFAHP
jgi:predicted aspartyl protease